MSSERLYHIWAEVTDRLMVNYGKPWRVTVEPALTHDEACTVLGKHTSYKWRRMWLVEVGSPEEHLLTVNANWRDVSFDLTDAQLAELEPRPVTVDLIKDLRARYGVGMADAKQALEARQGIAILALEYERNRGTGQIGKLYKRWCALRK